MAVLCWQPWFAMALIFNREGVLKMIIINSILVLLFLCKCIALGSKQFKGLLYPHDRLQYLNFRGEFYWVYVTFQYITQTLCTVFFFSHIFHFRYQSNSILNMSRSDIGCFVKNATCHVNKSFSCVWRCSECSFLKHSVWGKEEIMELVLVCSSLNIFILNCITVVTNT